ncbi:MAG: hypothetical protein BIFFINMI_01116 [Phycisphaerae bacterium]|nr:hypothetical protein [Phycisphaerae bacterium]
MTSVDVRLPVLDSGDSQDRSALEAAAALMPWAISICFHIGLMILLMFIIVYGPQQADDVPVRPGTTIEGFEATLPPPPIPPTATEGLGRNPGSQPTPADVASMPLIHVDSLTGIQAGPPKIETPNDETPTVRVGPPGDPGFGDMSGTGIFGLPGPPARKVVYVVDSSGSMTATFPYLQKELVRIIERLATEQEFAVIFFSDGQPRPVTIERRIGLAFAGTRAKAEAKAQIYDKMAINDNGSGSTRPAKAIELAFRIPGGPPEQIVFLTDGRIPNETEGLIDRLNVGRKVRVDTIAYVDQEASEQLKRIAGKNGGSFLFVSREALESGDADEMVEGGRPAGKR